MSDRKKIKFDTPNDDVHIALLKDSIKELYDNLKENQELEVSYSDYFAPQQKLTSVSAEQHLRVLGYMSARSNIEKLKLEKESTLDVIYSQKTGVDYRVILSGVNEIDNSIKNIYFKGNN